MFRAASCVAPLLCLCMASSPLFALDPHKAITQYPRTVWTQQQGLPQDTIRAIAQTSDGYLWLGTDEGLARFDGYEFVRFSKDNSALPGNSITALLAAADGSLWISTSNGITRYQGRTFTTYSTRNGLADNTVGALYQDHEGTIWFGAGVYLTSYRGGKFRSYTLDQIRPLQSARYATETHVAGSSKYTLYIAGFGGLLRKEGDRFVPVLGSREMTMGIVTSVLGDREGNLWIGGSMGLLRIAPDGTRRLFDRRDGVPDNPVRALCEDRDGNFWAGTNGGLSRLENGRFTSPAVDATRDPDWVRSLLEDREGNLWVGMNSGLSRFRDGRFTVYGRSEGMPSDEPLTVHQDRKGNIWVGYHGGGLMQWGPKSRRVFTMENGLPSSEIFSIRDGRDGELLLSTRDGLSRMTAHGFENLVPDDPLSRPLVYDALLDRQGRLWAAAPGGVYQLVNGAWRSVVPAGALLNQAAVTLAETRDGSIWAGTYGEGLWHVQNDGRKRLYTEDDGLGADAIRALYEDTDGTLWIGTFGGGLTRLRNGAFRKFTARDGLLSDNIWHIEDDGASFWLSTTRGICRVTKRSLNDLADGRIRALTPMNYGLNDGLRSAQCAPGYPAGAGGTRTADGRLWFPTSKGLAIFDPGEAWREPLPPLIHLTDVLLNGESIDANANELAPGSGRMQFRFAAVHLRSPERVQYAYRLEGLDRDWVLSRDRHVINYNSLHHGDYRFLAKAFLPGGPSTEVSYAFRLLPRFYETAWFRCLAVLAAILIVYGVYQLRLRQIHSRYQLVLEERARLAREIHDTLAQGFVGISSQLEAVAMTLAGNLDTARKHLEVARKMTRHSLTEARRSVMDLRASALDGQDLPKALADAARQWSAGTAVNVDIEVDGERSDLADDVEQQVLRIAQEAVANALKHAKPRNIDIRLRFEPRLLLLRVKDDGRGFEPENAFSSVGGHFGILGMRERAERIGGELRLQSSPGVGTQVEVSVPLPR